MIEFSDIATVIQRQGGGGFFKRKVYIHKSV